MSGLYTLTINVSMSGNPICNGSGICASVSLCVGTPDTAPARIEVAIDRSGDEATVRAADGSQSLAMRLNTASVPATGSISGTARDARGVAVDVKGTLTGQGSTNPAIAASGSIDGDVTIGGAGCSNNGHTWTLSRS